MSSATARTDIADGDDISTTTFKWRLRVPKHRKRFALQMCQRFFPDAWDEGAGVVMLVPRYDGKHLWLFILLRECFGQIESVWVDPVRAVKKPKRRMRRKCGFDAGKGEKGKMVVMVGEANGSEVLHA